MRGPKHVVKRGKTPVLAPEEPRQLLDSINTGSHAGLRDRALIALMVYTFARIGAATAMTRLEQLNRLPTDLIIVFVAFFWTIATFGREM